MLYRTVEFSNFMAAISNFTRENALRSRLKLKALVYLQVPYWVNSLNCTSFVSFFFQAYCRTLGNFCWIMLFQKFKRTFPEFERQYHVSADSGAGFSVNEAGKCKVNKFWSFLFYVWFCFLLPNKLSIWKFCLVCLPKQQASYRTDNYVELLGK